MQLRVRALETILTEKGYVDPAALDAIIEAYETRIGPHNGARAVAKAWADPDFKRRCSRTPPRRSARSASRAASAITWSRSRTRERLHNMIVCTLCSCYPWEVLGLPPTWYKSAPYRSRTVIDPRGVLADFGVTLPAATEIRVWDSTAETRFIVLPMRPAGTDGWSEDKLAALVTRDSMIGTGLARRPDEARRERRARHGRHAGLRPGRAGAERAAVPLASGRRASLAMNRAMGYAKVWNIDTVARRDRGAAAARLSRA